MRTEWLPEQRTWEASAWETRHSQEEGHRPVPLRLRTAAAALPRGAGLPGKGAAGELIHSTPRWHSPRHMHSASKEDKIPALTRLQPSTRDERVNE